MCDITKEFELCEPKEIASTACSLVDVYESEMLTKYYGIEKNCNDCLKDKDELIMNYLYTQMALTYKRCEEVKTCCDPCDALNSCNCSNCSNLNCKAPITLEPEFI